MRNGRAGSGATTAAMAAVAAMAVAAVVAVPREARCDKRNTVWGYEAKTMPAGAVELEYYLTAEGKRLAPLKNPDGSLQVDDAGNPLRKDWGWSVKYTHQAEVEVGVTDTVDVGVYTMFSHADGNAATWDGYKLRARVLPVARGTWPVDLAFYLEWIQGVDSFAFEEKAILQKNFGGLFLNLNLSAEQEGEDWGKEWVFEFAPTFALGYEFNPHVSLSLETLYKIEHEEGKWTDSGFWLGPTLSVMTGPVWLALGGMYQPTESLDFPRWQARAVLGVFL